MSERDIEEIFPKNFLNSVACEIRFDPLLTIQNKIPEFQEKIRGGLPAFGIGKTFPLVESSITSPFGGVSQWVFKSRNEIKTLKVVFNKIVFIVSEYSTFEEFFREAFEYFNHFFEICGIESFFRIGLRFVNEFRLSEIEESPDVPLTKYFNIVLDEGLFEDYNPFQFESTIRCEKDDNALFIKHEFSINPDEEAIYVIDIDAFKAGELKKEDLETIIRDLHTLEVKEFHKSITDELVNVLRGE